MKRAYKYWPSLILLVVCVVFSAGYLALAQEQENAAQTQEQEQQVGDAPQISTGKSGMATKGSPVNFSELAKRESLLPAVPVKDQKVIHEPGRPGPLMERRAAAAAAAAGTTQAPDFSVEPDAPQVASPAPLSTFKALEDNNASIPPDTHGAVGPNHLMVVLNTQIRIQTRTGTTISTASLDSFWSGMPGPWAFGDPSTFDPKILYDPYTGRWIFTVTADGDEPTSAVLVAVSKTSDPTGLWNRYKVDVDSTGAAWADYPSLGFNKNWVVVTVNMFAVSPASGFKRGHIYAFNKANLVNGAAGSFKVFQDVNAFTQAPAITYDNTLNPLYLVEDWDGVSKLRISSLNGTAAAPTYSATHFFPTSPAPWAFNPPSGDDFAPQLGSANKIQTNDSRIQNVVYRAGSLWCVQTIFLPSGASPTRSSIQWWELTPTSAVIKQRGRIDDPTGAKFFAFPSIAVNSIKDVLIGYSRFSSQQYASANYSFRAGTDAVNTLRTDALLKAGSAPYFKTFSGDRNRWGDYSSTVVDPLNDLDLWTVQEHAAPVSGGFSRWGTWWGRIGPSTAAPLVQLGTVTATDGNAGDADTIIEPGENGNKLTIQLKNTGGGAATGVSATLTTTTAGVTITQGTSAYPNLAAKTGVGNNTTPFTFNVASSVPCGTALSFKLTVTFTGAGSPVALSFTVPTGKAATAVTKAYAGAAVSIPDNTSTGVNIPLAVSGVSGNISDLNFKIGGTTCTTATGATTVGIDHTWVGDLVITLKSPQGTVVSLINQAGGVNNSGQNYCNTVLDDQATNFIQNITPAQAPYTGSFKPNSPLSAFNGQNPNGTWTLNVSDRGLADIGHVRAFSLIITPLGCSTTAQATPVEVQGGSVLASLQPAGNEAGIATPSQIAFNPTLQAASRPNEMAEVGCLNALVENGSLNEPYIAESFNLNPPFNRFYLSGPTERIGDELALTPFVWKRFSYMNSLLKNRRG